MLTNQYFNFLQEKDLTKNLYTVKVISIWENFKQNSFNNNYLIVFPVRILTHCGIGLFCFCFLARRILVLKDLWAAWNYNIILQEKQQFVENLWKNNQQLFGFVNGVLFRPQKLTRIKHYPAITHVLL